MKASFYGQFSMPSDAKIGGGWALFLPQELVGPNNTGLNFSNQLDKTYFPYSHRMAAKEALNPGGALGEKGAKVLTVKEIDIEGKKGLMILVSKDSDEYPLGSMADIKNGTEKPGGRFSTCEAGYFIPAPTQGTREHAEYEHLKSTLKETFVGTALKQAHIMAGAAVGLKDSIVPPVVIPADKANDLFGLEEIWHNSIRSDPEQKYGRNKATTQSFELDTGKLLNELATVINPEKAKQIKPLQTPPAQNRPAPVPPPLPTNKQVVPPPLPASAKPVPVPPPIPKSAATPATAPMKIQSMLVGTGANVQFFNDLNKAGLDIKKRFSGNEDVGNLIDSVLTNATRARGKLINGGDVKKELQELAFIVKEDAKAITDPSARQAVIEFASVVAGSISKTISDKAKALVTETVTEATTKKPFEVKLTGVIPKPDQLGLIMEFSNPDQARDFAFALTNRQVVNSISSDGKRANAHAPFQYFPGEVKYNANGSYLAPGVKEKIRTDPSTPNKLTVNLTKDSSMFMAMYGALKDAGADPKQLGDMQKRFEQFSGTSMESNIKDLNDPSSPTNKFISGKKSGASTVRE